MLTMNDLKIRKGLSEKEGGVILHFLLNNHQNHGVEEGTRRCLTLIDSIFLAYSTLYK